MNSCTNALLYDPERVARAMTDTGTHALVATTAPNIQYLTRYRKPGNALAIVLRSAPAQPVLIVPTTNVDSCLEDPSEAVDVRPHGVFYRDYAEDAVLPGGEALVARLHRDARTDADQWMLLVELLSEVGLTDGPIGVDGPPEALAVINARLPSVDLRPADEAFRRLRSVKTPEEARRLAEAAKVTETAIAESTKAARPGVTQRVLARAFRRSISDADCWIRSDSISIDGGAALGDVNVPSDVVRDGSVIRYDVGAIYAGYASDISRCFVLGTPDPKVVRYHAALVAGQERALSLLRPGITATEIFDATVSAVREAGIPYYRRTHVGHGIGVAGAGYDAPLLSPDDDTPLEPGMVLCVETPYYELGFTGLQVEDMVVVTDRGYTSLTHTARALQRLP